MWIVLIAAPVFSGTIRTLDWKEMFRAPENTDPLLFIFLINRFILVPGLLFKKKRPPLLDIGSRIHCGFHTGLIYLSGSGRCQEIFGLRSMITGSYRAVHRHRPTGVCLPPPPGPGGTEPIPPFANLLIFSFLLVGFDTGLRPHSGWLKRSGRRQYLKRKMWEPSWLSSATR